jgi:hypothetical protein
MKKRPPLSAASLELRVVAGVRAIASQWPFVTSVSDHFAGYFNELGITLEINCETRDEDLIRLQNELLAYLNRFWSEEKPEFSWMVMFSDGSARFVPMVPGDLPRTDSDGLRV